MPLTQLRYCSPLMFTSQGSRRETAMLSAGLCRVPGKMSAAEAAPAADQQREGALRMAAPHPAVLWSPGSSSLALTFHPLLLTSFPPACLLFLFPSFLILILLLTFCLRSLILNPVCPEHYIVRVVYHTQICLPLWLHRSLVNKWISKVTVLFSIFI